MGKYAFISTCLGIYSFVHNAHFGVCTMISQRKNENIHITIPTKK